MPRNKKSKGQPFGGIEFVRCELDAADRKKLTAWVKSQDIDATDLLIRMCQANHKVSYSFNETNDSFICSVTGKPDDCINASKCYTSHAKDPVTAFWVAAYKYFEIWKGGAWESTSDEEDFG